MAKSTITIGFAIDDKHGSFQDLTNDVNSFAKALGKAMKPSEDLKGSVISWAATAKVVESLGAALNQVTSFFTELTAATAVQEQAETQLASAMQNTMAATDGEIQAIKDLCSAQQQLGVIGDEVQLQGAAQLSGFLTEKESLEALIPVINDVAAARYGLNVTGENLSSIAQAIGKAVNGQTKILRQYGITLTDTQADMLKYGDEATRVQVITDALTEKFGGANEALAKTASGGLAQMRNNLGDMREKLGAMVQPMMRYITFSYELLGTVTRFKQLSVSIKGTAAAMRLASAQNRIYSATMKALGVSANAGKVAILGLKTAIVATEAALTAGLTLAIQAVIEVITRLVSKSREAKAAQEDFASTLKDANSEYASAQKSAQEEVVGHIHKLRDLMDAKQEDADLVSELNDRYGSMFGTFNSVSQWYDVLTRKAGQYCKAKALEARLIANESNLLDLQQRQSDNNAEAAQLVSEGRAFKGHRTLFSTMRTDEGEAVYREALAISAAIEEVTGKIEQDQASLASVMQELGVTALDATAKTGGMSTAVNNLSKDIEEYYKSVQRAVDVNRAFYTGKSDESVMMEAMKSGIVSLVQRYGLESEAIKRLIEDYNDLSRARMSATPLTAPASAGNLTGRAEVQNPTGLAGASDKVGTVTGQLRTYKDVANEASEATGKFSNAFSSLSSVLGEGAAAWANWVSELLSAVAQAIPAIATLVASLKQKSAAEAEAAVAGAMSSTSSIPVVGPALAIASAASVTASLIAALAKIPAFASGGVIYGPTLGLVGEYPGASHNPEVIAPLDKLTSVMDGGGGTVEFRISGDSLVGILNREGRRRARS